MDERKKGALRKHHQHLRTSLPVRNILPVLRPMLTAVEYSQIQDKESNTSKVDELIDVLLTKENRHFDAFCTALKQNGYDHWGRELQKEVEILEGPGDDVNPHATLKVQYPVIDELADEFAMLIVDVEEEMRSLSPKRLQGLKALIKEKLKSKGTASTVPSSADELISTISDYWDCLSFEFARLVVLYLGKEELQTQLKRYEETLQKKAEMLLTQCKKKNITPRVPPGCVSMKITVDIDPYSFSLHRLLKTRDFLVHRIGMDIALFTGWKPGSIFLHFCILEDDKKTAVRQLQEHKLELELELRAMQVVAIEVGDVIVYRDTPIERPSSIAVVNRKIDDLTVTMETGGPIVSKVPAFGSAELDLRICKRGCLWKTGGDRTGWKKRFCTLDSDSFKYFKDESCSEELGGVSVGDMLSVSKMDDDSMTQGGARHFQFEVTTVSRVYLLGCDSEPERSSWLVDFQRVIPPDAGERLGFDRIGYLQLNYKIPPLWRQHWFTLKSKQLTFYKRSEEKEVLDLRKLTSLKGPESGSEEQSAIQMVFPNRTYLLKAGTVSETDLWYNAIRHTQVSGIPLQNQVTTSGGVPVIVHKCIQFVEAYGMEVEGVYRHSGQKAKIQRLTLEFNQDAKGVVVNQEIYNVHDVTGTMKQFFRNLPDPLLTHHLYDQFIECAQLLDHESQLYQLQSLIDQLPTVNRVTLKSVLGHLNRVISHESQNKMGLSNVVRIFGPTLMTVDGDTISFTNSVHEFKVISIMLAYYTWLFQVDEAELKKEQAMEEAMQRLEAACQQQISMSQSLGQVHHSSTATFIVTVYLLHRDGDSCNIKAGQLSSVEEVTEKVAVAKALEPDHYALYMVLGDAVSERFLHPSERILQVIQDCRTDHYLCIKPNTLHLVLRDHLQPNRVPVNLWVKEKKKWSKKTQPAAVLSKKFILYKAAKAYQEVFKVAVDEFDLYIGFASDIKCPAPTRYQFWLKGRSDDMSKYLCADTDRDMFIIIGAILHAKFPEGISTPVVPRDPVVQAPPRVMPQLPPPSLHPQQGVTDSTYLNVTINARPNPKVPSVTSLS